MQVNASCVIVVQHFSISSKTFAHFCTGRHSIILTLFRQIIAYSSQNFCTFSDFYTNFIVFCNDFGYNLSEFREHLIVFVLSYANFPRLLNRHEGIMLCRHKFEELSTDSWSGRVSAPDVRRGRSSRVATASRRSRFRIAASAERSRPPSPMLFHI